MTKLRFSTKNHTKYLSFDKIRATGFILNSGTHRNLQLKLIGDIRNNKKEELINLSFTPLSPRNNVYDLLKQDKEWKDFTQCDSDIELSVNVIENIKMDNKDFDITIICDIK